MNYNWIIIWIRCVPNAKSCYGDWFLRNTYCVRNLGVLIYLYSTFNKHYYSSQSFNFRQWSKYRALYKFCPLHIKTNYISSFRTFNNNTNTTVFVIQSFSTAIIVNCNTRLVAVLVFVNKFNLYRWTNFGFTKKTNKINIIESNFLLLSSPSPPNW
jgi:hypothetical protein